VNGIVRIALQWSSCTQYSMHTLSVKLHQRGLQISDRLLFLECKAAFVRDAFIHWVLICRQQVHAKIVHKVSNDRLKLAETQGVRFQTRDHLRLVYDTWQKECQISRLGELIEEQTKEAVASATGRSSVKAIHLLSKSHRWTILFEVFTAWVAYRQNCTMVCNLDAAVQSQVSLKVREEEALRKLGLRASKASLHRLICSFDLGSGRRSHIQGPCRQGAPA